MSPTRPTNLSWPPPTGGSPPQPTFQIPPPADNLVESKNFSYPERSNTNFSRTKTITTSIVAGLLAGTLASVGTNLILPDQAPTIPLTENLETPNLHDENLATSTTSNIRNIATSILPSVVSFKISTQQGESTGSGFIYREDGYIVTNNHVVDGAQNGRIEVTFQNGKTVNAKMVGKSTSYDIAVVKVEKTNLSPPASLGNSDRTFVGDPVVAIGSPLGLNGTVTSGIISSLARPVTTGNNNAGNKPSYISAVQTDAAINPGNSGGPLINEKGNVIGVNSAIATVTSSPGAQAGSIGLGFAIPINQVKRVADEIIQTGKSTVPAIGVSVKFSNTDNGAQLETVEKGGAAAVSGLLVGDVVTRINDTLIRDNVDLVVAVRAHNPGDTVTVDVKGKPPVTVTLGSAADNV